MSKYNRHNSVISRQSDESEGDDHWFQQFQKTLLKDAVQARNPDQASIFDQINGIMNGKSKYSSVEAAVIDMQERSGLTAYLKKIEMSKKASEDKQDAKTPIVIQKHPGILNTIENCIRDTNGNLSVPAIIDKIRSIHQSDVSDGKDWDDDKLVMLVSKLNLKAKANNSSNFKHDSHLGSIDNNIEIDPSNTDAFFGLNPVKQ